MSTKSWPVHPKQPVYTMTLAQPAATATGSGISSSLINQLQIALAQVDGGLATLAKIDRSKLSSTMQTAYDAAKTTGTQLKTTGSSLVNVGTTASNWLSTAYTSVKNAASALLGQLGLGGPELLLIPAGTVVAFVAAAGAFAYAVTKIAESVNISNKTETYNATLKATNDPTLATAAANAVSTPPGSSGSTWDLASTLKWGALAVGGVLALSAFSSTKKAA